MKINFITGHFGNIKGKKFNFSSGMNTFTMENESGKTTLCALIRTMLYGLNTTKRDSKNFLSDKTKYYPHNNEQMSGRMEITYKGREVVITRNSRRNALMQDFDAYYKDTGEKVLFLTDKDCGRQLLGIGEEGFLSSAFIDGTDLSLSPEELYQKMLAMVSTGDTNTIYASADKRLERWKLDINSGNGHGEYPQLVEKQKQVLDNIQKIKSLQQQISDLQSQETITQKQIDTLKENLNTINIQGEKEVSEQSLKTLEKQTMDKIEFLHATLPSNEIIKEALDSMYSYEGAVKLEKERRERLSRADKNYQDQVERLKMLAEQEDARIIEANKPRIRWWALIMAGILALTAALSVFTPINWGEYTEYVPYILSGFAVIAMIIAFFNSVPRPIKSPFDFKEERIKLEQERKRIDQEQQQGAEVLTEAYDRLILSAKKINANISGIEDAIDTIKTAYDTTSQLKTESMVLSDIKERLRKLRVESSAPSEVTASNNVRSQLDDAESRKYELVKQISMLKGKRDSIGNLDSLKNYSQEINTKLEEMKNKYDAILYAKQIIGEVNASMTSKVSPEITRYAKQYMEILTGGKYTELNLRQGFEAECGQSDSSMLDVLKLSSGTRDQLYLALRLAICKVVLRDTDIPIILDDPFITFDDHRTQMAMRLLENIAKERQVILLTSKQI